MVAKATARCVGNWLITMSLNTTYRRVVLEKLSKIYYDFRLTLRIASLGEEQPELVHAHALGVLPAHAADRALDERGLLLLQLVDAHLVLGLGLGLGLGLEEGSWMRTWWALGSASAK